MNDTLSKQEAASASQRLQTLRASRLQRLLEISTKLSSTLDLKQLLEQVIEAAIDLTDAEHAVILLAESTISRRQFTVTTRTGTSEEEVVGTLEKSLAGWIVENGEALVLDDVERDAALYVEMNRETERVARNMLGVPLATKGQVIGALAIINKRGEDGYSFQDIALAQALASQAAVTIENARLFQQTDLIAEFMHELKTPLMALTAASEILAREQLPDKHRELLEMMQHETLRLSKMAQDFLDLARLESGRLKIGRQPVDLEALVNDVARLQESQAAARGITIFTSIGPNLPTIAGDYDRLKQVLLNLTSNAFKYNVEQGEISIRVKAINGEVVIAISDTGPGIAPENLPHLFERFYRVPDEEGYTEGSGLGLPIAKRILEEHGGRIEVASELGQGSAFYCYLPAE